jgi:hypothetical protein
MSLVISNLLFAEHVNESIDALHGGTCLRAVVEISESGLALQVGHKEPHLHQGAQKPFN